MAFSDLANNQMVSFTDAQSSGFPLNSGQSHVTSNQLMTKSDALAKYTLNSSTMSAYLNNQLVPKIVWQGISAVGYPHYISPHNIGYSTPNLACGNSNTTDVLWSTNSGITAIGDTMYLNSTLSGGAFNGGNLWYHSGELNASIQISNTGVVLAITNCVLGYTYSFYGSASISNTVACSVGSVNPYNQYSDSASLVVGSYLYNDIYLGDTMDGDGLWYYGADNKAYQVLSDGYINDIFDCGSSSIGTQVTGAKKGNAFCLGGLCTLHTNLQDITVFTTDGDMSNGQTLYSDADLTIPYLTSNFVANMAVAPYTVFTVDSNGVISYICSSDEGC